MHTLCSPIFITMLAYSKSQLITDINKKLAGESLSFNELQLYIDATIDDINSVLNACYPTTSEMERAYEVVSDMSGNTDTLPIDYKYWNGAGTEDGVAYLTLFPMAIVRRVIVLGAALKWLIADEEGLGTASTYNTEYQNELFLLQRDYSNKVPAHYQATEQGYVQDCFNSSGITFTDYINGRVTSNVPIKDINGNQI